MSSERKPVLYLAGPMTGIAAYNFPAFDDAAARLRAMGYRVVNPADFGDNPKYGWGDCMKRCLAVMPYTEAVVALLGWESSNGATLEVDVAMRLGMPVYALDGILSGRVTP